MVEVALTVHDLAKAPEAHSDTIPFSLTMRPL